MTGHLIGLTGHARAGKDEFAKSLALRGFTRMGMSEPLLEMAQVLNPLLQYENGQLFELNRLLAAVGYEEAKLIPSVRHYLQTLGTDAVRGIIGQDAWVRACERRFVSLLAEDKNVVVTGIRIPAEHAMIKSYAGTVIKIVRDGCGPVNGHNSEAEIDTLPVDMVIFNNGTVDDLGREATRLIASMEA